MVTVTAGTGPSVMITSPADGATLTAGDIQVLAAISGFNLVNKLGQEPVAGEGHLHYYMDVDVPTTPGQPAVTQEGTYAVETTETSHTWTNVGAGTHIFAIQLVNNNHTPLEPPVFDSVTVTVEAIAEEPPAGSVTIELSANNLAFDKSEINVPAGARVTINFNNKENFPHNFALYETPAATETIFKGEVISGPRTITYTFIAPSTPGTYFFRCDVHPTIMYGDFVVGNPASQQQSGGGYY
jgi:plastocyanin